ncbi:MAG: hydroxyacylglutathione hydrolase [Phycisphaerae bacterium]|nr:hydroxyacylglutathione hydrolase [Phycisphaerae bacterium]
MSEVITIEAFGDNYFYLFLYDQTNTVAIDCGDSCGILKALDSRGLRLDSVLITHHHYDHSSAAKKLKKKTGCTIISPDKKRIPETDRLVTGGDILDFGSEKIRVIATPGHTSSSVCYYVAPSDANAAGMLFTGDTMFIGGCGRIFECDAKTMWQSLSSLADLPNNTLVYPGHDYTEENYRFALTIDPQTTPPAMPSTIACEKTSNIFLRSDDPAIKKTLGMPDAQPDEIIAKLRSKKDKF